MPWNLKIKDTFNTEPEHLGPTGIEVNSLYGMEKRGVAVGTLGEFDERNIPCFLYVWENRVDRVPSIDLNWYMYLKENHDRKLEQNKMAEIIEGIHILIGQDRISFINSILSETLNESSSPESMVTLLRSSFPIRNRLSEWKNLYRKSREWLSKKNFDPDSILVGLA